MNILNFFYLKSKLLFGSYIKNFSWMMTENLIKIGLGLSVSIYLTRYLGPYNYGVLTYAVGITGMLSPIATLGIDAILLRNIIQDKNQEKTLLQTARILKFTSAICLTILSVLFFYFTREDKTVVFIMAFLMIGVSVNSLNVYKEYFISINKMRFIAYSSIISLIISNFFRVGLIISSANLLWFAFAILLANIINVLVLKIYYGKISEFKRKYFSWIIARKLLNDSWPLIFTSFAGVIFIYVDQIIIEFYFDFDKVGVYGSAVRLLLFFTIIPSIISNMIYPKVVELYEQNQKQHFIKKMVPIYFFHLIFALLLISIFIVFGRTIILTLYGASFIEAVPVLQIYSITFLFVFFNPMNNKLLMLENLQKLMLFRNLIGLVFNVILNLTLIPVLGIKGAAFATILSQISIIISYYFNSKTRYLLGIKIRAITYPLLLLLKQLKK
jgi:O-antigen/teichoic acid export membrane protein